MRTRGDEKHVEEAQENDLERARSAHTGRV